jgi:hypothetical protein
MSNDNLYFSLIFIHQRHQLYICKHNLQAAIDKEDCRSRHPQFNQIMALVVKSKIYKQHLFLDLMQVDLYPPLIKGLS